MSPHVNYPYERTLESLYFDRSKIKKNSICNTSLYTSISMWYHLMPTYQNKQSQANPKHVGSFTENYKTHQPWDAHLGTLPEVPENRPGAMPCWLRFREGLFAQNSQTSTTFQGASPKKNRPAYGWRPNLQRPTVPLFRRLYSSFVGPCQGSLKNYPLSRDRICSADAVSNPHKSLHLSLRLPPLIAVFQTTQLSGMICWETPSTT